MAPSNNAVPKPSTCAFIGSRTASNKANTKLSGAPAKPTMGTTFPSTFPHPTTKPCDPSTSTCRPNQPTTLVPLQEPNLLWEGVLKSQCHQALALTSTAAWPTQLAQARLIVSPVSLSTTQVTCTIGSPPGAGRVRATHSSRPLIFLPPLLSVDWSCQRSGQPPAASGLPPAASSHSSLCRTQ